MQLKEPMTLRSGANLCHVHIQHNIIDLDREINCEQSSSYSVKVSNYMVDFL